MYTIILRAAFVATLTLVSHAALALSVVDVAEGRNCYAVLVDPRYPPALNEVQMGECETSINLKTRSLLVMYQAGLPSEEMDQFVERMLGKWHSDVYNPDTDAVAVVSNYPRYVRFFPPGKLHAKINATKIFQATPGPRYQQALAVLRKIDEVYQAQIQEEGRLRAELDATKVEILRLNLAHADEVNALLDATEAQREKELADLRAKHSADWWRRTIAEIVAAVIAVILFVIVAYLRARRRWQILRERLLGFKRFLKLIPSRLPNNEAFQKHMGWEGKTQALILVLAGKVNRVLEPSATTLAEVETLLPRGNFVPDDIERVLLRAHDIDVDTTQLESEWKRFISEVERAQKINLAHMNTRADEILGLHPHNEYRALALREIAHLREEVAARFLALEQDPLSQLEEFGHGEKDFLNLLGRFALLTRQLGHLRRIKDEVFVNGFLIRMVRLHPESLESILAEIQRITT